MNMLSEPGPSLRPNGPPRSVETPFSVVVVRDEAGLLPHLDAWRELARRALEPNAFYEPWFLLPALRAFGPGTDLRFVLVYGRAIGLPGAPTVLAGFFPLVRRRLNRLVPLAVFEPWRHLYNFLCTPLLRQGDLAEGALSAALNWMRHGPERASLFQMQLVHHEGPFAWLLQRLCQQHRRPLIVQASYVRALCRPGVSAEDYLLQALPTKRRKAIRKHEQALAALGKLERRILEPNGDVEAWIAQFLALEASGWKGREKTALGDHEPDATFFREMARRGFEQGQLQMLGLFLDDNPIAMKCNLLSPPGAFAFKIAFDEKYSAHSPGVVMEAANLEHLHTNRSVEWMDSCAEPDHPMIDRLWTQRRAIQTVLVSTGRAPGDLVASLYPAFSWLKNKFRRTAPPAARKED